MYNCGWLIWCPMLMYNCTLLEDSTCSQHLASEDVYACLNIRWCWPLVTNDLHTISIGSYSDGLLKVVRWRCLAVQVLQFQLSNQQARQNCLPSVVVMVCCAVPVSQQNFKSIGQMITSNHLSFPILPYDWPTCPVSLNSCDHSIVSPMRGW